MIPTPARKAVANQVSGRHCMIAFMPRNDDDSIEIATPAMLRTLRYVRTLNDQGVRPSLDHLNAYADAVLPRVVLQDNYNSSAASYLMMDHHYESVNTVGKYVMQVGWVEMIDDGAGLTAIGRAISTTAGENTNSAASPPAVNIMLRGNDPVSYVDFLEALQRVGGGGDVMLIDPYLPSTHVPVLMDEAGVTRVLTSDVPVRDARESRADRTRAFGLLLGARVNGDKAVRYAEKGSIHDRLVLPSEGTGLMLGRSLGGSHLTAVVELTDTLTSFFRDHYEPIWSQSQPVEAIDLSHVTANGER